MGTPKSVEFFNINRNNNNKIRIKENNNHHQGRLILLDAEAQNRTYTDKNGAERLVTEFLVNRVYFTGEKANNANTGHSTPSTAVVASTPAPASANSGNSDFNAPEDDYPF